MFFGVNLTRNACFRIFSKLSHDMETTKVALENERKIQQLQMQAINALWKKVSTLQPPPSINANALEAASTANLSEPNSTAVVQDLAKTCSVLTNQVRIGLDKKLKCGNHGLKQMFCLSFSIGSTAARINA